MFRRLLIANRGEVAARIIRACRKLNIETVAVYSTADARSPHLDLADTSVCIGPGPASESYLAMDTILQAAEQYDCQALHPGFGFLAENALFAARVIQHQIAWIGPSPHAIASMGDKACARQSMAAAGMPTVPGSGGILSSADQAAKLASEFGYPVLLKATAGGGGKGMRLCNSEPELHQGYSEASMEAEKAFGNSGLYLEKALVGARHIEFQLLADVFGSVVHLGERECSVQRRHQKLLEEAPSPAINDSQRQEVGARAAASAAAIGYSSAGTMELLLDNDGGLYFMEMNTRLQVEHPVTEMVYGVDIVEQQIRIAANEPLALKQESLKGSGHSIEFRINAEDPDAGFAPDPGEVTVFEPPSGDGIRVETHLTSPYQIPPFYDSMIAKLVVWGSDRPQALQRAAEALAAFKIEGVKTTIPIHKRILGETDFREGRYDTLWLEKLLSKREEH